DLPDPVRDPTIGQADGSLLNDGAPPGDALGADGADAGSGCGADLTSDPVNCGACGHDCLGGTCMASKCQPVILASSQGGPTRIAVWGSSVYWTNITASTVIR